VDSTADAHASENQPKISDERETAFDQLVLPKGHKRVLLSLIAQHFRDKEATRKKGSGVEDQVDIVRGKGISITGSTALSCWPHIVSLF
jgi:hypothetical protein